MVTVCAVFDGSAAFVYNGGEAPHHAMPSHALVGINTACYVMVSFT